jgi:hypothetical protein
MKIPKYTLTVEITSVCSQEDLLASLKVLLSKKCGIRDGNIFYLTKSELDTISFTQKYD